MSRATSLRDWGWLLACNLTWAGQFVLVKLVQDDLGPVVTTFAPMLVATAMLWLVVRVRGGRTRGRVPPADVRAFLLLGVLGQVAAQLLVTWGARSTPASNGALLQLALPVVTAVMAFLVLGERMSVARWLGFGLALAGVVECAGIEWGELRLSGGGALRGNLLVFGGVLGSAFYNVYGKKLLARYSPLEVLLYSYYAVCVTLAPIALALEPEGLRGLLHVSGRTWLGLGLLAVAQYFLSMVVFLTVLTRLDATQAAVSNYLIPVFGVALGALVLGERLTPFMMAGGALVLASSWLVAVHERRTT
jgi:drug/metabolite transporter (DMT)-like permease